jgi:hypothetical protein
MLAKPSRTNPILISAALFFLGGDLTATITPLRAHLEG